MYPGGNCRRRIREILLNPKKRFLASKNFQISKKQNGLKGLYIYLNFAKYVPMLKTYTKALSPKYKALRDKVMAVLSEISFFTMTAEVEIDKAKAYAYVHFQQKSELHKIYKSDSSYDFVKKMPDDPLAAIFLNLNQKQMLFLASNFVNDILPSLQLPNKNLKSLFALAEKNLFKKWEMKIDIESFLQNFTGNTIIALYSVPTYYSINFDMLAATKVRDREKIVSFLEQMLLASEKKGFPFRLYRGEVDGIQVYHVEIKSGFFGPKIAIKPTIALVDQYLLLTAKPEMLSKIFHGKTKGLSLQKIADPVVVSGIKNGSPFVAYVKIKKLANKIAENIYPFFVRYKAKKFTRFTNFLKELNIYVTISPKGVKHSIILRADKNFVSSILHEINLVLEEHKSSW